MLLTYRIHRYNRTVHFQSWNGKIVAAALGWEPVLGKDVSSLHDWAQSNRADLHSRQEKLTIPPTPGYFVIIRMPKTGSAMFLCRELPGIQVEVPADRFDEGLRRVWEIIHEWRSRKEAQNASAGRNELSDITGSG